MRCNPVGGLPGQVSLQYDSESVPSPGGAHL